MFIIVLFVLLIHVAIPLVCHRKECSEVLNCGIGWDTCEGTYCYMLRLQNVTNSQNFLLRRGCFGDDSPQIRYNAELKPFTSLNECRRTVWKDIEYLVTICADNDYCNVCNFWTETKPETSGVVGKGDRTDLRRRTAVIIMDLVAILPIITTLYLTKRQLFLFC